MPKIPGADEGYRVGRINLTELRVGLQATRAIRAAERRAGARRRLPVIAMTANAARGDEDACRAAGMDDHVTKPVRRKRLYAALARFIAPSSANPRPEAA